MPHSPLSRDQKETLLRELIDGNPLKKSAIASHLFPDSTSSASRFSKLLKEPGSLAEEDLDRILAALSKELTALAERIPVAAPVLPAAQRAEQLREQIQVLIERYGRLVGEEFTPGEQVKAPSYIFLTDEPDVITVRVSGTEAGYLLMLTDLVRQVPHLRALMKGAANTHSLPG